MRARPHRFLQYLQDLQKKGLWHEIPALEGHTAGERTTVSTVAVENPGRAIREIRYGMKLFFKWIARLVYLSPLLIIARFVVGSMDRLAGDMITVGFVCLVVSFFVMLNLYIVWSVVVHFKARGAMRVALHFDTDGEDLVDAFKGTGTSILKSSGEPIRRRGIVVGLGESLPGNSDMIRDLWAVDGLAPWRLTEALDFAIVTEDERPLILTFNTAPMMIARPVQESVGTGVERMTPGMKSIFDLGPATSGDRKRESASYLTLSEGDEVEVIGMLDGGVHNVARFELGSRVCTLVLPGQKGHDPYRGTSAEEGLLVRATPSRPVWIRKLADAKLHNF